MPPTAPRRSGRAPRSTMGLSADDGSLEEGAGDACAAVVPSDVGGCAEAPLVEAPSTCAAAARGHAITATAAAQALLLTRPMLMGRSTLATPAKTARWMRAATRAVTVPLALAFMMKVKTSKRRSACPIALAIAACVAGFARC